MLDIQDANNVDLTGNNQHIAINKKVYQVSILPCNQSLPEHHRVIMWYCLFDMVNIKLHLRRLKKNGLPQDLVGGGCNSTKHIFYFCII